MFPDDFLTPTLKYLNDINQRYKWQNDLDLFINTDMRLPNKSLCLVGHISHHEIWPKDGKRGVLHSDEVLIILG